MANRTDVTAIKIFGSNPQYLISNIIRSKIYESQYWKEKCFALTSESIIDQAINLKYVGGTYGGNRKPTRFLCLILKLLQIQPDKDIVYEYIKNEDFIYLRALGIFYLRLIGKSLEIYKNLEPVLFDYRKIRIRLQDGTFQKIYMDEFVDNCLILNNFLDVDFPTLTKRQILEENNLLEKRNLEYYKELLNISSDNELLENDKDKKKKNSSQNDNEENSSNNYDIFNKNCTEDEDEDDNKIEKRKKKKEKRKKKEKYYEKELRKEKKNEKHENKREEEREKEREKDREKNIENRKKKKKHHIYYDYKKNKYSSESESSYSSNSKKYYKEKEKRYAYKNAYKKKKKKKDEDEDTAYEKKIYFNVKKKDKDYLESSRKNDASHNKHIKKNQNNKNDSHFDENKKEDMSIDQWNKIRKELGMKPLK